MGRRNFLAYAVGMIAAPLVAQRAIMEGNRAVTCDTRVVKCPNNHETCAVVDAPLAVGNDRDDYPEVMQLQKFHVLRCDVCHVLFTRE